MRRLLIRLVLLGLCVGGSYLLVTASRAAAANELSWQLVQACESGNLQAAKDAIARGADINRIPERPNQGRWCNAGSPPEPPLVAALEAAQPGVATYLLNRGADFERPSFWGTTVLEMAATRGEVEIVQGLLQRGARSDHFGGTFASVIERVRESRKHASMRVAKSDEPYRKDLAESIRRYDRIIRLLQTSTTNSTMAGSTSQ